MSHSVTIRTATVTSSSASHIIINTGYLKTYSGILKVLELLLGIACVGIIGHNFDNNRYNNVSDQFFFLMVTTFMIATFILILSCLVSLSTESIISKTVYEVIYHSVAFGLLLAAALTLLIKVNNNKYSRDYELLLGAAVSIAGLFSTTDKNELRNVANICRSKDPLLKNLLEICGLVNSALYFFSTIIALRSYRGL